MWKPNEILLEEILIIFLEESSKDSSQNFFHSQCTSSYCKEDLFFLILVFFQGLLSRFSKDIFNVFFKDDSYSYFFWDSPRNVFRNSLLDFHRNSCRVFYRYYPTSSQDFAYYFSRNFAKLFHFYRNSSRNTYRDSFSWLSYYSSVNSLRIPPGIYSRTPAAIPPRIPSMNLFRD